MMNDTDPFLDNTFFYVSGFTEGLFESSTAIIDRDGEVKFMVPMLEMETARRLVPEDRLMSFSSRDERLSVLKEEIKGMKSIGINPKELTYSNFKLLEKNLKDAKFVDLAEPIKHTRLVKDQEEIEIMRKAAVMASEAVEHIIDHLREGVTENQIAAELTYFMLKKGASGNAFIPIVGFGPHAAEAHYFSGEAKLKKGDFILMDFGARYMRYNSDITRTLILGPENEKQVAVYEAVKEAQQLGLDNMKAGVNGRDIDTMVREFIDKKGYEGKFNHSTGHSLGLAVHDGSAISHRIDQPLEENMVFTVEPGIYLSNWGGVRIEDDVVVKKDGVDILTTAPRELVVL